MVSSDNIVSVCRHFDYTCWAIQLHVGVANVENTNKFVDQRLGCHSRGVSVNDVTRTVTNFAAPRLGLFLSGIQHSVPDISHKVPY